MERRASLWVSFSLNEIKSIWHDGIPEYPEQDVKKIMDAVSADCRDVCCCFYLFRYLHLTPTPGATLAGDYCFARFSKHLSDLDSVPMNDAFAEYLKEDTASSKSLDTYLDFVRTISEISVDGA